MIFSPSLLAVLAPILGTICILSEISLVIYKRSGSHSKNQDQGSMRIVWLAALCSVPLGRLARVTVPQAQSDILIQLAAAAVGIFAVGMILRWVSVIYLGRFFTVNVAIADGHQVIDTGPYRLLRHPSYTGLLLMFLGTGIASGNLLTLLIFVLLPAAALLHRIAIEEAVLSGALGSRYVDYMSKTKRLIPFVY